MCREMKWKVKCLLILLINKNYFPENSKILVIHTGGLQGITGMNNLLKQKNQLQISIYD